jgi:hypothetical protein
MAINITQGTIDAVQEMVRQSFICNSFVDRLKSVLGVNLAYNNTANKIHLGIAHAFPIQFGDVLGDLLEGYNQSIIYGGLPIQNKTYLNAKEALDDLLEMVIDYQNKLNKCAMIAFENMDIHTYSKLLEIIEDYKKFSAELNFSSVQAIPVSGLEGDNITKISLRMLALKAKFKPLLA